MTQAYRLLAYSTPNCIDKIEYFKMAYSVLDDLPELAERRLLSYNDFIDTQYNCTDYPTKISLKEAFQKSSKILSNSDSKNDIDRSKIDMSIKYCILYKNNAETLLKNNKKEDAFKKFSEALDILNSTEDIVLVSKTDPSLRLKWWLQKIDLSSRSENLNDMVKALKKASEIAKSLNFYEKKNTSSLAEFYQVQGLIHYHYRNISQIDSNDNIAKESLIKAYAIKYLLGQGTITDLRRITGILKKYDISGLPDNYAITAR